MKPPSPEISPPRASSFAFPRSPRQDRAAARTAAATARGEHRIVGDVQAVAGAHHHLAAGQAVGAFRGDGAGVGDVVRSENLDDPVLDADGVGVPEPGDVHHVAEVDLRVFIHRTGENRSGVDDVARLDAHIGARIDPALHPHQPVRIDRDLTGQHLGGGRTVRQAVRIEERIGEPLGRRDQRQRTGVDDAFAADDDPVRVQEEDIAADGAALNGVQDAVDAGGFTVNQVDQVRSGLGHVQVDRIAAPHVETLEGIERVRSDDRGGGDVGDRALNRDAGRRVTVRDDLLAGCAEGLQGESGCNRCGARVEAQPAEAQGFHVWLRPRQRPVCHRPGTPNRGLLLLAPVRVSAPARRTASAWYGFPRDHGRTGARSVVGIPSMSRDLINFDYSSRVAAGQH
jgi:hypothetical protein